MLQYQPLLETYEEIFNQEREKEYPAVDALEERCGYDLDSARLLGAARVLACPVKINPPNWQHGRILYSLLRCYLADYQDHHITVIDIGTAKGFSALCMQWAMIDSDVQGQIYSVDVINPNARVMRNTVADCAGVKTLYEILEPWPEHRLIKFMNLTGTSLLSNNGRRINFAFVDGKHKYDAVSVESRLLGQRQVKGDIVVFDDVQIPGVDQAVSELKGYTKEYVVIAPQRKYCIATKE